jgi:hypothetical protein
VASALAITLRRMAASALRSGSITGRCRPRVPTRHELSHVLLVDLRLLAAETSDDVAGDGRDPDVGIGVARKPATTSSQGLAL